MALLGRGADCWSLAVELERRVLCSWSVIVILLEEGGLLTKRSWLITNTLLIFLFVVNLRSLTSLALGLDSCYCIYWSCLLFSLSKNVLMSLLFACCTSFSYDILVALYLNCFPNPLSCCLLGVCIAVLAC